MMLFSSRTLVEHYNEEITKMFMYFNLYFWFFYVEYNVKNSNLFFIEKNSTREYTLGIHKMRCVITPRGVINDYKQSKTD